MSLVGLEACTCTGLIIPDDCPVHGFDPEPPPARDRALLAALKGERPECAQCEGGGQQPDPTVTPHSWHARDCSRHQFNQSQPPAGKVEISMPGRDEVPEGVLFDREVALATERIRLAVDPETLDEAVNDLLADFLAAAAPAIRNQERQRIQGALNQLPRYRDDGAGVIVGGWKIDLDAALAALDTLDPSGEDCELCGGSGLPGFQARIDAGEPCDDCNGTGKKPVVDPSGEQEDVERYVRGDLAEEVIERLEERETEAKETLERLNKKREAEGVERSAPASPGQLVAYTEKRIYRDAIYIVSDTDLELHVFPATPATDPSKEESK